MFRGFSSDGLSSPTSRQLEDAPPGFRLELVDVLFSIGEAHGIPEQRVYEIVGQSLGQRLPGNPMSSRRLRAGGAVGSVTWPRVLDLVLRFAPEFLAVGAFDAYRDTVNKLLAGYGIAWDLAPDGRLSRVMPELAAAHVASAFFELSGPAFAPALALLTSARDAYDDRPRRDRDACANAFDALESVAKQKYTQPASTFGQVVRSLRQSGSLNPEVIGVLEAVNTLRNRNFGHGMTTPFALDSASVDFTYVSCVAGILLLTRTP